MSMKATYQVKAEKIPIVRNARNCSSSDWDSASIIIGSKTENARGVEIRLTVSGYSQRIMKAASSLGDA